MASEDGCGDAHIVLTGPMGSGKTTVGRLLARRLDRPFYDSDAQIEAEYGTSARRLAREHGVDWLHKAEAKALVQALAVDTPSVVAAAASIGDLENLGFLGDGVFTVLLEGESEVLAARAVGGPHRRSLSLDRYRELSRRRHASLHHQVDLVVDVTSVPPGAVTDAILQHCRQNSASSDDG